MVVIIVNLLVLSMCQAQPFQLKSYRHGLDDKFLDISKEELINEMQFENGIDNEVDVIRFDHVGSGYYPLIISSKLPLATDSLGILSFTLQRDTLKNFLEAIDGVTPKIYSRKLDDVLVRVTYRFGDHIEQYYVTNKRITTGFMKIIERKLVIYGDKKALSKFYSFISEMGLHKNVHGKREWIY